MRGMRTGLGVGRPGLDEQSQDPSFPNSGDTAGNRDLGAQRRLACDDSSEKWEERQFLGFARRFIPFVIFASSHQAHNPLHKLLIIR